MWKCDIYSKNKCNKNISSYSARHSFATNLNRLNISTYIISEAFGHSNLNITQAYLKGFEDDVIDDTMNRLLEEPIKKYA